MVYLNVKYVIATRNYDFLLPKLTNFCVTQKNDCTCTCWTKKYKTVNYQHLLTTSILFQMQTV